MTSATIESASEASRPASGIAEDRELFVRWQHQGDEAAREALVARFLPLARSLARRYARSSEPFDDLLQVASLGLLKAIDRFDVERGSFASFAVPTVLGEIRRYFRDCGWTVHVPRGAQERALKVREAEQCLADQQGHAPTVNQLAEYLELDTEEVIDALQAIRAYQPVSIDRSRSGEHDDDIGTYADTIGELDERFELVELRDTLATVTDRISERDRLILHLRFVEELTQQEIAGRVGVSQMQVSRLLARSLEELRALAG